MTSFSANVLVQLALNEDIRGGDVTSNATIPEEAQGSARLISREPLVVCGHEVAAEVFRQIAVRYGFEAQYQPQIPEGQTVSADTEIATLSGSLRAILSGERTALNFLQRLSGIATKTRTVVEKINGTNAQVLDTRKTAPGWRELEKHAVLTGGGTNHRHGLYDAVLIKNNHVDALQGDIGLAIHRARDFAPEGMKIQAEVRSIEELKGALSAEPDAILLDNMSPEQLQEAVSIIRQQAGSRIAVEASGGITEVNVYDYAASGVDYVSLGSITHSARAVDISLRYTKA